MKLHGAGDGQLLPQSLSLLMANIGDTIKNGLARLEALLLAQWVLDNTHIRSMRAVASHLAHHLSKLELRARRCFSALAFLAGAREHASHHDPKATLGGMVTLDKDSVKLGTQLVHCMALP